MTNILRIILIIVYFGDETGIRPQNIRINSIYIFFVCAPPPARRLLSHKQKDRRDDQSVSPQQHHEGDAGSAGRKRGRSRSPSHQDHHHSTANDLEGVPAPGEERGRKTRGKRGGKRQGEAAGGGGGGDAEAKTRGMGAKPRVVRMR